LQDVLERVRQRRPRGHLLSGLKIAHRLSGRYPRNPEHLTCSNGTI